MEILGPAGDESVHGGLEQLGCDDALELPASADVRAGASG